MNKYIKYGALGAALAVAYYIGKAVGAYVAEESFKDPSLTETDTVTETEAVEEETTEGDQDE